RIVGNMEAAPAHHAFKIDVKHQSNGPQSYAYFAIAQFRLYFM
ncbi:hypothetical protein ABIB87_008694, partial [Bradyrhizobium sp. JR18.2]